MLNFTSSYFFIENICIYLLDIFSIERTKNIFEKAKISKNVIFKIL